MDQSLFPKLNSEVATFCRASALIKEDHTIGPLFYHGPSLRIADAKAITCIGCQAGSRYRRRLGRYRCRLSSRGRIATRRGRNSSSTSASQTASAQQEYKKETTNAQCEPETVKSG